MAERTSGGVTLRSPWLIAAWFLALLGTGLGLVVATEPDPVALVLGGGIAAVSALVLLRVPFMRVTVAATGLTIHGLFSNRHVPLGHVVGVALEQTDDKVVGQVYAPVLRVRGDAEVALDQLSGFSTSRRVGRSRVGRQTETIRNLLGSGG